MGLVKRRQGVPRAGRALCSRRSARPEPGAQPGRTRPPGRRSPPHGRGAPGPRGRRRCSRSPARGHPPQRAARADSVRPLFPSKRSLPVAPRDGPCLGFYHERFSRKQHLDQGWSGHRRGLRGPVRGRPGRDDRGDRAPGSAPVSGIQCRGPSVGGHRLHAGARRLAHLCGPGGRRRRTPAGVPRRPRGLRPDVGGLCAGMVPGRSAGRQGAPGCCRGRALAVGPVVAHHAERARGEPTSRGWVVDRRGCRRRGQRVGARRPDHASTPDGAGSSG